MTRHAVFLFMFLVFMGCATKGIQTPTGAQPVVRHTNWKKWNRLQPEQTIEFGSWRVHAPDQSQSGGTAMTKLGKTQYGKHRMNAKLQFQLQHSGASVAAVSATATRSVKTYSPASFQGRFKSDGDDLLEGRIELAGYTPAEFSVTGFSSDQLRTKATGSLTVNQHQVRLREVDAPWYDKRDGFAGVDFFVNDQHIGQVVRGHGAVIGEGMRESVWIDQNQPTEVQTAIAGMSATLLLASRLEPPPPPADKDSR